MEFSKELREKLKTYFFNRFGIVLTDDKANSYLYSLGSLGLILADSNNSKGTKPPLISEIHAPLRKRPPIGAHRKAQGSNDKGTDLVTQCPQSANKSNTSKAKKPK